MAELADEIADNHNTVSAIRLGSSKNDLEELESKLSELYSKIDSMMNDHRSRPDFRDITKDPTEIDSILNLITCVFIITSLL